VSEQRDISYHALITLRDEGVVAMADETVRAIHVLVEQLQRLTAALQADDQLRVELKRHNELLTQLLEAKR
jgi:hypothetical protein